ncbi:MAG: CPBP family intramembrane metalloprotease [Bacteroidales bacterium]|nr:CPBP family intramembrane metalloprotease [Bacteroidales bacterium]
MKDRFNKFLNGNPNLARFYILLLAFFICYFLKSLIIPLIASVAKGIFATKMLMILSPAIVFALPAIIYAKVISSEHKALEYIGFKKAETPTFYLLAAIFTLSILPFIEFVSSINAALPMPQSVVEMDKASFELTRNILHADNPSAFILNLIALALAPAICEEMFFRGTLQKVFLETSQRTHFAIIFTALIFSAMHLQFSGIIPRFLLGLVLGYLYHYSKSIWVPIMAHFTNNACIVCVAYFSDIDTTAIPEISSFANPIWIITICVGLVVAFLVGRRLFKRV